MAAHLERTVGFPVAPVRASWEVPGVQVVALVPVAGSVPPPSMVVTPLQLGGGNGAGRRHGCGSRWCSAETDKAGKGS